MTFVNHFFFIGLHAATWLIGLLCLIMSTFDLVERVDAYRTVAHFLFDLKMFRTIVVREMVAFVTAWLMIPLYISTLYLTCNAMLLTGLVQNNTYLMMPWLIARSLRIVWKSCFLLMLMVSSGFNFEAIVAVAMRVYIYLTVLSYYLLLCGKDSTKQFEGDAVGI